MEVFEAVLRWCWNGFAEGLWWMVVLMQGEVASAGHGGYDIVRIRVACFLKQWYYHRSSHHQPRYAGELANANKT